MYAVKISANNITKLQRQKAGMGEDGYVWGDLLDLTKEEEEQAPPREKGIWLDETGYDVAGIEGEEEEFQAHVILPPHPTRNQRDSPPPRHGGYQHNQPAYNTRHNRNKHRHNRHHHFADDEVATREKPEEPVTLLDVDTVRIGVLELFPDISLDFVDKSVINLHGHNPSSSDQEILQLFCSQLLEMKGTYPKKETPTTTTTTTTTTTITPSAPRRNAAYYNDTTRLVLPAYVSHW